MILETVLSDRYVCQISCFYPQVKYLGVTPVFLLSIDTNFIWYGNRVGCQFKIVFLIFDAMVLLYTLSNVIPGARILNWHPTRFPYQMKFVSIDSKKTGVTSRARTTNPSRGHEFTPSVKSGSCYSTFSFLSLSLLRRCDNQTKTLKICKINICSHSWQMWK
jgi:hypothetical protein